MNGLDSGRDNNITLKILDEINSAAPVTQRSLSGKLNIALGLVNAYIKRLAKKGYIKINKGPMNRVKYALTPKGFAHRVDLTYHYMQSSINYFQDSRKRIDNIYGQMIEAGVKTVLIWGDGEIAELSYISMRGLPLSLAGVVDSKTNGKDFFGHKIYAYEDVLNINFDAVLVASFSKKELQQIKALGINDKRIYSL